MSNESDISNALRKLLSNFPLPPTQKPKPLGLTNNWASSGRQSVAPNQLQTRKENPESGSFESLPTNPNEENAVPISPLASFQMDSTPNSRSSSRRSSFESPGLSRLYRPSDVGTKFDERSMDLLLRACKGNQLTQKEQQDLYFLLQEFNRFEITNAMEKVQLSAENASPMPKKSRFGKVMNSVRGKEDLPIVKISSIFLDFVPEGKLMPVNKEMTLEFVITNIGNEKVKFKFLSGMPTKKYDFSFNPKEGVIKKKLNQTVKIGLIIRTTTKINHILHLEIEGGQRFYLVVRGESEKSVFGVDFTELPKVIDVGVEVPVVLVTMKNYLLENGALNQPGIFRTAGDDVEGSIVKDQLNRGTFVGCRDVNCVANLIKAWFRDLPQSVLGVLPNESFHQCEEESDCVAVYESIPEPNKSLMKWILELLADTASVEATNKMNPRNLAFTFSPNLHSNADADPVESLVISQKVGNFIQQLIVHRVREKYKLNPT